MMDINLLPWRIEKQAREKKLLRISFVMSVCIAITLLISMHGWLSMRVHSLEMRLRSLQRMFLVDESGEEILNNIDPLFSGVDTASAMNDAARIRDAGACWKSIVHETAGWQLTGVTLSPYAVTAVMRLLTQSRIFGNLHLSALRKDPAGDYFQFVLSDQKSHADESE